MSGRLHNPDIEHCIVLITIRGSAFDTYNANNFTDEDERGIDFNKLMEDGWQVVSITPSAADKEKFPTFLLLLARRREVNAGGKSS